jgi:DNA-binding transcriptional LysR family regulator
MTLIQLKYVIACEKNRSFSAAAKEMFTSTSNISKAIHNLEVEIGYQVFNRSVKGLEITDRGKLFLKHTKAVFVELDCINNLDLKLPIHRLKIAGTPISFFFEAFTKFVSKYENEDWVELQFVTNCRDIPNSILIGESDLGLMVAPKGYYDTIQWTKKGIVTKVIASMGINFYFRKDHPIVLEYQRTNVIPYERFSKYPMIDYDNNTFLLNYVSKIEDSLKGIDRTKTIKIDDRYWKIELVKRTSGFSLGTQMSETYTSNLGIYTLPVDNAKVDVLVLYSANQPLNELAKDFLALLKEEFNETP